MEHGVSGALHTLDAHGPRRRMEQGELLGGAAAAVFMGIPGGLAVRLPVLARERDRRVGACLVFRPDWERLLRVGGFDQLFFASVSGSWTVTMPALRLRTTVPVSHQLRSCCQV